MRPRSLRTKVVLAVVVASMTLLALSMADVALTVLPKFHLLDDHFASGEKGRVSGLVRMQLGSVGRSMEDWGNWDPMDEWVRHPGQNTFAQENLQPSNLKNLGLSFFQIYDSAGNRVLSLSDPAGPPPLLVAWAKRHALEWSGSRDTTPDTGVTCIGNRFWGVVVHPIRKIEPGSPASGILVGALPLDFSLMGSEADRVVPDTSGPRSSIDSMSLRVEAPSLPGLPEARMSIHRPREVWLRGLDTLGQLCLAVALLGGIAALAMARMLDRLFLRRMERLRSDLAAIQDNPGRGLRVSGWGSGDDMDRVADQINATLASSEEIQAHLVDAQRIARLGFWHLDLASMRVHVSAEHIETAALQRRVEPLDMEFTQYLERFVHPEDRERLKSWAEFVRTRPDQPAERDIDYRTVGYAGEVRHLAAACRKRSGEEGILFLVAQDVTDRRRIEDELLRGSLYDSLTGLPNRNLVIDRLALALGKSDPGRELVSLIILDLDRFGAVNASMGRDVGDGVLLGLAVRLVGSLPPGSTVGRMSHHEFGVVLEMPHDETDRVAEILRTIARTPILLGGRELVLTGSVGVASAHPGEVLAEELLTRVESAVYTASARGGDNVAYFDEERSRQARDRVEMEFELGKAIGTELELHYQPIVHLASGALAGFEALVRWRHPVRGLVSPLTFIPIAERSGLIHELGMWVMEEAMRRVAAWQSRLGESAPFMSINLSVRQFHHDDLADRILDAVARTGVDPRGVKLEITESALSEDPKRVASLLEHLCATGLRFSLDDFGTGYSSLGYLSRFPVQTLKVDKSFVDELGQDEKKTRITSAIVTLAHSLDMDVVAEGIETDIQRERLLTLGCEYGQGFLFSKPLPGPMAEEYLGR